MASMSSWFLTSNSWIASEERQRTTAVYMQHDHAEITRNFERQSPGQVSVGYDDLRSLLCKFADQILAEETRCPKHSRNVSRTRRTRELLVVRCHHYQQRVQLPSSRALAYDWLSCSLQTSARTHWMDGWMEYRDHDVVNPSSMACGDEHTQTSPQRRGNCGPCRR